MIETTTREVDGKAKPSTAHKWRVGWALLVAVSSALANDTAWRTFPTPAGVRQFELTPQSPFRSVALPVEDVSGQWLRVSAAFSAHGEDHRLTIAAHLQGRRVSFSAPTRCNRAPAQHTCRTEAWIPHQVDQVTLGVWSATSPVRIDALAIEAGRASANTRAVQVVDELIKRLEALYYRSKEVDWQRVANAARSAARSAPPQIDSAPAAVMVYLVPMLPDHRHTRVMLRERLQPGSHSQPLEPKWPLCVREDASTTRLALPSALGLTDEQLDAYIALAHRCILSQSAETAWIVDLRNNLGGHAEVLLSALSPFFDGGTLFGWADAMGTHLPVELRREGIATAGSVTRRRALPVAAARSARVVAWIGPECSSACEAAALALRSRPGTLLIGQPTYGLATGNEVVDIDESFVLAVTAGRMVTRDGEAVGDRIEPHETISGSDLAPLLLRLAALPRMTKSPSIGVPR